MCTSLQCKEAPNVQKPQFFLWFLMFFTYRQLFTQAYKRHNIAPGACRTELPSHIVQKTRLGGDSGGAWGSLGPHLACFWTFLGGSRPLLGGSWAPLGHVLGALGRLLAALWSLLAAFWLPRPPRASILEGLGACRAEFWRNAGVCFSMIFALT